MKRSLILLVPAMLALASCELTYQFASVQNYPDGIYYRPEPVVELYTEEDFKDMAARQLASKSTRDTIVVINDYASRYYSYPYYYDRYYGPYWGYGRFGWGPSWSFGWGPSLSFGWYGGWYDPWDPWYDPYWGPSYWGPYRYYGGGGYFIPRPHGFVPVSNTGRANPGSYAAGGNNFRRSGSTTTRTATSSSAVSKSSYRRSGNSSGATVRSSTPPTRNYDSGSSYRSSGSYSSGGSYSGGGGHSGGSGGGGGGRR